MQVILYHTSKAQGAVLRNVKREISVCILHRIMGNTMKKTTFYVS